MTREEMREELEKAIAPIAKQVSALHTAYFGNGNPGIKVEVDRLVQKEKFRLPVEVAMILGVLGWLGSELVAVIWHVH